MIEKTFYYSSALGLLGVLFFIIISNPTIREVIMIVLGVCMGMVLSLTTAIYLQENPELSKEIFRTLNSFFSE